LDVTYQGLDAELDVEVLTPRFAGREFLKQRETWHGWELRKLRNHDSEIGSWCRGS
jgi:hypothetical protein